MGQFDAIIRVASITASLLLAWLLFRRRLQIGVPAYLFAPLAVCLSGFLAGNIPDPSLRLTGVIGLAAHYASGWTVVFLWWFCLACFDRLFKPSGGVLAAGLIWFALATADRVTAESVPALGYSLVALGLGIVGHLIWRLYAEREGDLIQKRYNARLVVALALASLLLIDLCVDLLFGFGWRPLLFTLAQNAAILAFLLWLAGRTLTAQAGVLNFEGVPAAPRPTLPALTPIEGGAAKDKLRQRLTALIEVERIHLDPDLTFADFVQRMNAPERAVRNLVNHELGFDHFRSFLNHYRIVEARRILREPGRATEKLIAVALDSGFASLPSFNRVFRASEGCSPSHFKASALAAHSMAGEGGENSMMATGFEKRSAVF